MYMNIRTRAIVACRANNTKAREAELYVLLLDKYILIEVDVSYELASLITPSMEDHLEGLIIACPRIQAHYTHPVLKTATRQLLAAVTHIFGNEGEAYLVETLLYVDKQGFGKEVDLSMHPYEEQVRLCTYHLVPPLLLNALRHYALDQKTLPELAQKQLAEHDKTWTALFPLQFELSVLEPIYPGLLPHAYIVSQLSDEMQERIDHMHAWLNANEKSASSSTLPDNLIVTE